ncbi:MAG: hypothetical protein ABIG88_00840 [Patescibacteria group bacterium]
MVQLNFIIICDNAFITEGTGSLNVLGIFDKIMANRFPAMHPKFMIVTNISGDVGFYDQVIVIKNKTTNEEAVRLSQRLEIKRRKAQFLGNFINTVFKSPAEYEVEVYINGKLQSLTTNFYVEQSE